MKNLLLYIYTFLKIIKNYVKYSKNKTFIILFYLFPPFGFFLYLVFLKLFLSKNYLNYINFILGYRIFRSCIRFLNAEERYFLQNNLKFYNNQFLNNKPDDKQTKKILENLDNYGYSKLGKIFTEKECEEFHKFIENKTCYKGVVPMQSDGKPYIFNFKQYINNKNDIPYLCFLPEIVNFDPIQKFLQNKKNLDIFNSYLKFDWDIFSVLTWFNFPSIKSSQVYNLHRDNDDYKTLCIYIYWADCDHDTGALSYLESSHKNNNAKNKITLNGKKGDVFLINTHGLHCGSPLVKNYRLITQIRLGYLAGHGPILDGLVQAPSKKELSFLNLNKNNTL